MTDLDRALDFGERAAIREYEGGQTREEAEAAAAFEVYGSVHQRPSARTLEALHGKVLEVETR